LDGVRGTLPADINAAAHALAKLSVLAATLGSDLRSVDVNPVIVGATACVAVDALVITTDASP
jgi:hypothetical protein